MLAVRLSALLPLLALSGATLASDRLRMRVIFSETANLTYQLDLVSGGASADYQALWKAEFLKTDRDRAMLRQWSDLKRRYETSAGLETAEMPLQRSANYVTLSDRLRIAGLRAASHEAFLEDAALLMTQVDAARLAEVVRHFERPFGAWWKREPAVRGRAFVGAVRRLLDRPAIREDVERFRRFYAPTLPEGASVQFSLLYRPQRVPGGTSGQQIGSVGAVEFYADEKPERRLDVVLHEFCHFLYDSRPDAANLTLQLRFLESGDPAAKPALNLLNEAMATALGNGVIARRLNPPAWWEGYVKKPLSFYYNPYIDRAGKRLLGLVDEWLPQGRTMDDPAFVPAYLRALKEEFGGELSRPTLFLNEAFLYVDTRFGRDFLRETRNTLHVASAYSTVSGTPNAASLESYTSQPALSAIFVIPPSQLDALVAAKVIAEEDAKQIRDEVATRKSALFAKPRSLVAHSFFVVTDDVEEARKRVRELEAAPVLFAGLRT